MTGRVQIGDLFAEEAVRRFDPTQEEGKALREMMKVRSKNNINQFLLEFENWNVKAKVTGIAFRKLIRDQIPDEGVRRMSMHQEYADDRDWIDALRQLVHDEEDFQEGKRLQDNNFSGSNSSGKRKRAEPTTAKTTKKLNYTAKEERVYRRRKRWRRWRKERRRPGRKLCIEFGLTHIPVSTRK